MGTITTGVGLVSGMDIQGIVKQLMSIESRSREQLVTRKENLTEQQKALMEVQAMVLAVQLSASNFSREAVFFQKATSVSNDGVLTATANRNAANGSHQFAVKRLASTSQLVSRGYGSLDSTVGAGALSFEIGQGQLGRPTDLGLLNGGSGFMHGKIKVTDAAGNAAEIDLRTALTMDDVISAINNNGVARVRAATSGDSLVLTDLSGGAGQIVVEEVAGGQTARSLGLTGAGVSQAGGRLVGADIITLTTDTLLSSLNDGNGVRGLNSGMDIMFRLRDGGALGVDLRSTLQDTVGRDEESNRLGALNGGAGVREGKFRITDRNGLSVVVDTADLGPNATVGQLRTHIQEQAAAAGMAIQVNFNAQDHLTIRDNSQPLGNEEDGVRRSEFIIENIEGGKAATDLGIVGKTAVSTLEGGRVWRMDTVGDVINAINNHWHNQGDLVVGVNDDGTGLVVTDESRLFGGELIIEAMDSLAAQDLGLLGRSGANGVIEGSRLIAGLNTVLLSSLNGGSGNTEDQRITAGGVVALTDRAGNAATVDLTGAATVQEVLDAINDAGINLTAALNSVGNGIVITDTTAPAEVTGNLVVADVSGDLAAKLGIAADAAVQKVDSGNLQLQYISEAARLDDLRAGAGIGRGSFEITDSDGRKATVDLNNPGIETLGDVINRINALGLKVKARVNDNGDGLLLEETGDSGGVTMSVRDISGNAAADLNIAGSAAHGRNYIDGSYEFTLEVGGGDTLEDIVAAINEAQKGVTASIIKDGGGTNPYRISLSSTVSGRAGRIYFDAGGTTMNTQSLSRGEDAVVFMGDGNAPQPLVISSGSNEIADAVKGVTIKLRAVSDTPVTVDVQQDLDGIVSSMESFVKTYNAAMDKIDEHDYFHAETMERGLLFGDSTIATLRRNLQNIVQRVVSTTGTYKRLGDVGISFARLGTQSGTNEQGQTVNYAVASTPKLSFNEQAFRDAFAADADSVRQLFIAADVGVGTHMARELDALAGNYDSTFKRRMDAIESQQRLFQNRLDYMQEMLDAKERRLYAQFFAMEEALSQMQSQQTALESLSSMAASASARK